MEYEIAFSMTIFYTNYSNLSFLTYLRSSPNFVFTLYVVDLQYHHLSYITKQLGVAVNYITVQFILV